VQGQRQFVSDRDHTARKSEPLTLSCRSRLAKADPGNAGWQRDLSVSHEKIGDVQVEQGDLAAALASYQASLAIAERLAKADPDNAGWQRDLSVSQEKIGEVQQAQGDLAAAPTSYQDACNTIASELGCSFDDVYVSFDHLAEYFAHPSMNPFGTLLMNVVSG